MPSNLRIKRKKKVGKIYSNVKAHQPGVINTVVLINYAHMMKLKADSLSAEEISKVVGKTGETNLPSLTKEKD